VAGFVLVHGAWHGAWCWRDVAPALRAAGHEVEAIDLPGHGGGPRPEAELTLDAYVDAVCAAVRRAPRPSVLVGHSLGGLSITGAAERLGDRIDLLVYLCAFLPGDGQSIADLAAVDFEDSLAAVNQVVDARAGVGWIDPAGVRETFYGTCTEADAAWAAERLVPEALAPQAEPVRISAERGGAVPRMYVETLRDRAIPTRKQRAMVAASPVALLRTIDSDHSPFLSAPDQVCRHLEEAAAWAQSSRSPEQKAHRLEPAPAD
jgi:pimeloyl-ACP methyl ester carboxylesterase